MWEMTSLFESVGTVQDGIGTLAREASVVDAPGAKPLIVTDGRIRFDQVTFRYRPDAEPVMFRPAPPRAIAS